MPNRDLAAALAVVTQFIGRSSLTETIADLEYAMEGSEGSEVRGIARQAGISEDLLSSALLARMEFGRLSDVIHASAIALGLPDLLEPAEVLRRPSLGAGNDSSRPFDVETDRRVAEFKLARWDGHDATRKRGVFKDFVHLAAEESDRVAELYVVGQRPIRFLHETRATASWALNRFPGPRRLFRERFGNLDVKISTFVEGPGADVRVIDLEQRLPQLFRPGNLDSARPMVRRHSRGRRTDWHPERPAASQRSRCHMSQRLPCGRSCATTGRPRADEWRQGR